MQTQTTYLLWTLSPAMLVTAGMFAAAWYDARARRRQERTSHATFVAACQPVRVRATFANIRSGGYVTWAEGHTQSDALRAAYLNVLDGRTSYYPGPWSLCSAVVLPECR